MTIGEAVRDARVHKGLSQGEVATRSGIMRSYINRLENDRHCPSWEIMDRIADAIGIPVWKIAKHWKQG